jgi:hypothetical protein
MAMSSPRLSQGLVLHLGVLGEPRRGALEGRARASWRRSGSPRWPVLDDIHIQVELEQPLPLVNCVLFGCHNILFLEMVRELVRISCMLFCTAGNWRAEPSFASGSWT